MNKDRIIIAIDGPAGSGKSTIAKLVARRLDFFYIDTGAMYRALTVKAKRLKSDLKDEKALVSLMQDTKIRLSYNEGKLKVFLDEEDVSEEIRKPYISDGISDIAKVAGVRRIMTDLQRSFAKDHDCVLEGRDIGTVVFPQAKYKFFIDADFKERAMRRFKELKEKKIDIEISAVEQDLAMRDRIDSTRSCAPLKKADDAVYVDTTRMTIEEVVDRILGEIDKNKL